MVIKTFNGVTQQAVDALLALRKQAIEIYCAEKNIRSEAIIVSPITTDNSDRFCSFEYVIDGKTVSLVIVERYDSPEFAFVSWAATEASHRNKGYCTQLIEKAQQYLDDNGSQLIAAECQNAYLSEDRPFWVNRGFIHTAFNTVDTTHLTNINVID
ncbi:GNAT family N-acetyltransferase [Photobacterium damselae]|uniref:GNAT family N-acetyltransferase n=1 Tax=Photobacterium damselae TaxID=38293 RepID=UPI0040692AA5